MARRLSPGTQIHRSLSSGPKIQTASQALNVTVLLAPRASAEEIAEVRAALASLRQQSTLRAGTVLRGSINPRYWTLWLALTPCCGLNRPIP